jgi:GT2 family glycosyltransferase
VLVPSYNRPTSLSLTLEKLNQFDTVRVIFVAADASSHEILNEYSEVISKYSGKVVAELAIGCRGSAKTRNAVRKLALQNISTSEYVLLFDDDFQLPDETVLKQMIQTLNSYKNAGIVGGRIVNLNRHVVDSEFSLPVSQKVADILSGFTGFLFCGQTKGIETGKRTTCFMLIKSQLLNQVSYDENYQGTGYREESDFQKQVQYLGYKVLSIETAFVYHYAPDVGGCRESQKFSSRMYWKSRNHIYFIQKWNRKKKYRSLWYMLMSEILLIGYRPSAFFQILKGLQSGYKLANKLPFNTQKIVESNS